MCGHGSALVTPNPPTVGYAFFYPGVFSLITVPFMLLSANLGDETSLGMALTCVIAPLQLGLGLWALIYAAIAIKQLNSFSWIRVLGVLVWFPILTVIIIVATPFIINLINS